jgi:hypothetical protein
MALRFFVPKFITIEDKLAGLVTFRQLFSLLGAFLLTYFTFSISRLLGIIVGLVSFGIAILFTFVYINGKLFIYVLPSLLESLVGKRYIWRKIERITYKEVEIPQEQTTQPIFPTILSRKKKLPNRVPIDFEYKEVSPTFKERVIISLEEPIVNQIEDINKIVHRHLVNPKNPYRFFPYIKFHKAIKK